MAEEVEIINVGKDGVASEETLAALLEVMKKMAKSKGIDPDEVTKKLKDLADATENLVEKIEDHTRALEDNTDEVENNTSAIGSATRWITSAFTQAATSAVMLGTELLVGGDRLSDFSQHIPFIGSLITPLANILDKTINEFRDMTNIGVDFGESLIELRRTAAESGLSFDTFSKQIRNNSENLALFGGSARAGARIFTDVSRIVQRDFGPQFSALGMTMDQTAQFTADYLDMQRRLGNTERYNQTQLAFGTNNYIMMLDRLSKITGKQRDQIAEELAAQRNDVVFASFLSSLGPEIAENVQEAVSITPDIIKNGMRDLFSFGGNIATQEANTVASAIGMVGGNFGELQNIIQGINSGLRDESDLAEYINTLKSGIDETNRLTISASAKSGNAAAEMALGFLQFGEVATNISEVSEEQRKAMERGNQGLLDFSRRITELRNEIVGRLIDTGIFQKIESAASGLIDMLTGPEGSAALKNAIDSIAGFLEEFMADIQTVGLWNAIKDNLVAGLSSIWEEIKLQLFGGTRNNTDEIKSTESRITKLQSERQALGEKARRGGEVNPEQVETIDAAIQQLQNERDKLAQAHGTQIEGVLSGVSESLLGMSDEQIAQLEAQRENTLDAISALEAKDRRGVISEEETAKLIELRTEIAALDEELANSQGMFGSLLDNLGGIVGLLAGGLLAGGIVAIGAALLAATPGALGFGAAIGMAAGGVGYALHGVSSIMEAMADNTRATTEQIERLANIPGTNLLDAAVGIERMKAALDGFEPGFWEGLGDWFTGGVRQDSMAATNSVILDLAETFSSINPEVIKSAATAIVAMSAALSTFNEATSLQGVGDLAARLLGYQESATAISTLATNLQGIDGSNLENVAPGVVAVSQAVSQFQALTAIDSVGEGVSAALQSYIPLSNTVTDVATRLSSIENPERLSAVSPAITELATALGQFQQLTAIDSISETISVALGSYSAATTPLIELINSLSLIDGSKLQNAGPGIEALSNALTVFKNSTGFQGIGDLVKSWFSEDAMEIGTKIQTIANDLSQIDPSRLTAVSVSIVTMGNSLESFSNVELSDISINTDFVTQLQTLSTLSGGLSSTAQSLGEIANITGIRDNLDAINQGLDANSVNTYATAIEKLVENLNDLNEVLAESNDTFLQNNLSAAEVLGNITVTNQGNTEAVEELNRVMTEVLSAIRQGNEYERKIERNTASLGSDITSGRVSTIR